MAIERPEYSIKLSSPPLEIRDYAPTIVALVHVEGERSKAVNDGFRILANYIFGGNQPHAANGQTAPAAAKGESIAMTAPVEQQSKAGGWEVRFMMPKAYTMSTLPKPSDDRVQLLEIPRHRVAVNKFSGFWSDANLQSHEAQLLQWLQAQKLTATSAPSYAYYDPPWTPWFLRTIEVMVDVAPDTTS